MSDLCSFLYCLYPLTFIKLVRNVGAIPFTNLVDFNQNFQFNTLSMLITPKSLFSFFFKKSYDMFIFDNLRVGMFM